MNVGYLVEEGSVFRTINLSTHVLRTVFRPLEEFIITTGGRFENLQQHLDHRMLKYSEVV